MFKSRLFYSLWVSKDISRTIKDILHLENFSRELTRENFKVGKIKCNVRLKLESVGLLGRSWASLLDGRSHLAITLQCVNLGHLILLVFFIISRCSYWLNQKKTQGGTDPLLYCMDIYNQGADGKQMWRIKEKSSSSLSFLLCRTQTRTRIRGRW